MTHEPAKPPAEPATPRAPAHGAPSRPADRSSRSLVRQACTIALFSAAVQLLYLAESLDEPAFLVPVVDAGEYHLAAVRFAEGGLLYDGPFWQPPLFPLMLGVLYRFAGESILAAKLVLASMAVISTVLVWHLGRSAFSPRVGLLAAVLFTLNGPVLFYGNQLMPVGLAVLLLLLALIAWNRCLVRPATDRCALFGLLVGAATITIANCIVLVLLPILELARLAIGRREWRQSFRAASAVLLSVAAPVFAVAVRNYHVSGQWVLISTNGGINLYLGNNSETDRTLAVRPGEAWTRLTLESCTDRPRTPVEQQGYFFDKTVEFAKTQPMEFLAGLGDKAFQLLNAREIPRNEDIYVFRDYSHLLSALVWQVGSFGFPWGLLCPLALYSVARTPSAQDSLARARRRGLLLFLLAYGVSIVAFFVTSRYRVPLIPVLAIFAADGILTLVTGLRGAEPTGRRWRGIHGVALVMGLLLCNWPIRHPTDGTNFRAELEYFLGAAFADRQAVPDAELHFRSAIALNPSYAPPRSALANLYASTGRFDDAIAAAEAAIRLDPASSQAVWILADVYHRMHRLHEAEAAYRQALSLDPVSPDAHSGLASVLLEAGRTDEAVGHLRRAVQLGGDLRTWGVRLAGLLTARGEFGEAIQLYERASRSGHDPDVLNTLAWLLATCPDIEFRDCERATRLAERLCRSTDYQHPVALDTLAAAHAECGRLDQALVYSRTAVELATLSGDVQAASMFRERLEMYEALAARRAIAP